MSVVTWILIVLGSALVLAIAGIVYLALVLAWEEQRTLGGSYYRMPLAERRRFQRWLRLHARILRPVVRLSARYTKVNLPKAADIALESRTNTATAST